MSFLKQKQEQATEEDAKRAEVRRMTMGLLDQKTIEQLSRAGMSAKHKREELQAASRRKKKAAEDAKLKAEEAKVREMKEAEEIKEMKQELFDKMLINSDDDDTKAETNGNVEVAGGSDKGGAGAGPHALDKAELTTQLGEAHAQAQDMPGEPESNSKHD